MKFNTRKILTALTALTLAVQSFPAVQAGAALLPQKPASAVTRTASAPKAVTEEAQPAVTTGPADAYAANTGTVTTAVTAGTDNCVVDTTVTVDGTDHCVSEDWWYGETDYTETIGNNLYGSIELYEQPKTVYQIGEELDLAGVALSGGGGGSVDGNPFSWDLFPLENPYLLEEHPESVDASEFDNTTPGTYRIHVKYEYYPGYFAETDFEVTVVGGTENCISDATELNDPELPVTGIQDMRTWLYILFALSMTGLGLWMVAQSLRIRRREET